jgi:threonine aldolase
VEQAIDLRSDTVTMPSRAMRNAMVDAKVGDDVFGEDPTVNALQEQVADLLGKEAALFVPSGTMGNQICIKVHTKPGDEVIVERDSHVYNYETGAIAFLSSVQAHPVTGVRGVFSVQDVRKAIRPNIYSMSKTSLVVVENTHNRAGGTIFPLPEIRQMADTVRREGIGFHLDGARLWNAVVASGESPAAIAAPFDSVSVCFSKGLGAPVGSAVVGTRSFVDEARRYRKIFGGGMRQAGILAAAARYALEHNISRLAEDHEKAKVLATMLADVRGFSIDDETVQTNILIINVEGTGRSPEQILSHLRTRGVLLTPGNYMGIRAVTHLDVSMDEVRRAGSIIREAMA